MEKIIKNVSNYKIIVYIIIIKFNFKKKIFFSKIINYFFQLYEFTLDKLILYKINKFRF